MIAPRRRRIWRNWSGSITCEPNHCARPVNLEQIQAEVLRAAEEGERLRPIGSGLSSSALCWTDDNHLSLDRFSGIESADAQRRRVWVRAGTRLGSLMESLADRDWALENAPDNDTATVAGAIATASHGSGAVFGNLSTLVTGLRLVCADGSIRQCSAEQNPELFNATRVSLGALGIVSHVELQCVDHYRLRLSNRRATLGETLARLEELKRDHRNFEFFWFPYADTVIQRRLDETRDAPSALTPLVALKRQTVDHTLFRAVTEAAQRAPRFTEYASRAITQRVADRNEVLDARAAYPVRRRLRHVQMEYAIPAARVGDTLRQLDRVIRALQFRLPMPVEVRFVRRDDLWLSPQYERDSACISVPAFRQSDYSAYFAAITEIFDRADGRPHWGTVHDKTAAELRALYPRFGDFCTLREQLDPHGVFLNPSLAALLGTLLR